MKKTKKILALALATVMLVSATVAVTVAYLTSQDTVTNTFTVGKVKITLDEADVDDSDKDQNTTERDKANEYKVFPGGTYDKDPIVHVDDSSEDCYVFVKVVNSLGVYEAAVENLGNIEKQMSDNGWTEVTGKDGVWLYNGEFAEDKVVSKGEDLPVFTKFAIANNIENDNDLASKSIVVTAYAIQADGFDVDNAEDLSTMLKELGL